MDISQKSNTNTIEEIKNKKEEFEKLYNICTKGMEYENNGDIDSAIEQYEKCVLNKFDGSHPYQRLCVIYRKKERYSDEIRVIRSFMDIYPKQQSANINKMIWFSERLKKVEKLNGDEPMGLDYIEDREEYLKAHIEEIQKKVENSYPSKNGLKIPEIVMLYYARTYKTEQNNFQSFWYYDYGVENPEEMLLSLEQRGFICPASARESVNNLKVNELKELLKELDLKVSGKKEELITRIDENANDEWLEEKIKNRAYNLTDLAIQELKENKYVLDFHKVKIKYGVNVWWVNQQLYIRNYPKSLYRDLMYGELNRRLNEIMKEMQSGDIVAFVRYASCKHEIGEFFIEENRFNDAFNAFAEYAYYIINTNLLPYINQDIEYISKRIMITESFKKVKNELGLSDDDMFQRLINFYNGLSFPASLRLLSNQDAAGLIISLMNGENETVENLFNELENNSNAKIQAKFDNPVHRQSIDILSYNYNNDLSSSKNTQISTQPEQHQKNIDISEPKINNDPNQCTQEQKDPLNGWGGCLGCLGCMLVLLLIICLIIVAIKFLF